VKEQRKEKGEGWWGMPGRIRDCYFINGNGRICEGLCFLCNGIFNEKM